MAPRGDDDDFVVTSTTPQIGPADDEELIAGGRRPPPWLVAVAVGVVSAAVIALLVAKETGRPSASQSSPSPATSPSLASPSLASPSLASPSLASPSSSTTLPAIRPTAPGGRRTLSLGHLGPAVDLALATDGTLFVLGQNGIARVNRGSTGGLISTARVPPGAPSLVAIDSRAGTVWVVGRYSDIVYGYDADSLVRVGQARLRPGVEISAIAAQDGRLFLATESGLYELQSPTSKPHRVPGFSGAVQTITADPARHRLVAMAADHTLLDVRAGRVHRVAPTSTSVLIASVVVTDDGLWGVGFGTTEGSTRIGRLDPRTLRVSPVGSGDANAPQGAEAWAGGSVFWVRDEYSDVIACHNAGTGRQTAAFDDLTPTTDGVDSGVKIVSRPGVAYAMNGDRVMRFDTTRECPG